LFEDGGISGGGFVKFLVEGVASWSSSSLDEEIMPIAAQVSKIAVP
jgi:hypothetical protein